MSKNVFTPDGGPHRTSRVLDVSEGLKRIGEFEAAEMLAGYAALLRERESAKVTVTDEPRNEFPLLYDNLDALDERAAEQPNRIATARILTELRHQIGCVMTKLHGERAALKTVAPMLMADSNHCQCPACVDGIIHDADCAVHNEPAMPTGPCDCSKRASLDAAIFAGNPEPDAWISTVMCVGPDYGKEYYGKFPIQSLNPLYYKHTKLYKVPPPMLASARVPDEKEDLDPVRLRREGRVATEWERGFNEGWNDCRDAMLAAAPKPEKE